jgi:hypothetical protein
LPAIGPGHKCPNTPQSIINLNGNVVVSNGTGPFYFDPYGLALGASDFNKTPWSVASGYLGRLVIRGRRLDGADIVAFGFWPRGFGTPAEQPDVPVLFRRQDGDGRTVVYQPELDIHVGLPNWGSWRVGGNFWSFPKSGCYAIQADGDAVSQVTVVSVY